MTGNLSNAASWPQFLEAMPAERTTCARVILAIAMPRAIEAACLAALLACVSQGQTAAPLSFEVASVKPSKPPVIGESYNSHFDGRGIDAHRFTLRMCITNAYGVKDFQVSAPAWLSDERYDIVAKVPAGTKSDQVPEMLQTLLAERFKLQIHRETKEFPGFDLVVGKNGPKLALAAPGAPDAPEAPYGPRSPLPRHGTRTSPLPGGGGKLQARGIKMDKLARTLSTLLGRPVTNMTELPSRYDPSFEFTRSDEREGGLVQRIGGPPPEPPPGSEDGASVFATIQNPGLELVSRKVPLEVIVVDHAEKTPTENRSSAALSVRAPRWRPPPDRQLRNPSTATLAHSPGARECR
jgi:uncharacterized protein (TIGR03435 family)